MKIYNFLLILCFTVPTLLHAEMREWTSSSDPTRKIKAELLAVKGDMVALKMANGQIVKFELSKLSENDQIFAKTRKDPAKQPKKRKEGPESSPADVAKAFVWGEDPDQVYTRLEKNPGLRGGVNEILRGRTGLNGMYYIEPAGIRYPLFFDFGDDASALVEVSLQSEGFNLDEYDSKLKDSWMTIRKSLEDQYGKPALGGAFPAKGTITEGLSMSTDVWKTDSGEVYLGVGQTDGAFSCVLKVREKGFLAQ